MRSGARFLTAFALAALAGCAGPRWEDVRATDTSAAYRRYLAANPRSAHAAEARERLDLHELERGLDPDSLERFRRDHPTSAALPDLDKRVESEAFDAARADGTAAAYEAFLRAFPAGALRARAEGDLAFLAADGFPARPDERAQFAREHPESDYAAEAARSLDGLDARRRDRFGRVALRIEIAPGVGDAARLRAAFSERARESYGAAGVPLVDEPGDAVLEIDHTERSVTAQEEGGVVAKPGTLAETRVTLRAAATGLPVFDEVFRIRVADADRQGFGSALFAPMAAPYWERFYVPVATWPTAEVRRAAWSAGAPLSGVGTELGHAVVVSPDGGFREIDLSDPAAPRVVGVQHGSGPTAHYAGARRLAGRVVIFGDDGAQVFVRRGDGYRVTAAFDRGAVGAVAGVETSDGRLLFAGTRGLVRASFDGGAVERIAERPLRGIARMGDTLYLLDDETLFAGSAAAVSADSFAPVADLGRGLEPRALRVGDSLAVVIGARGVAILAVSGSSPARLLWKPRSAAVGVVSDAAALGGQVFLVGERGVQVVDPRTARVVDSIDVEGRVALGVAGSHLVAIGGEQLAVVDTTPWTARPEAAAALAP